MIVVIYQAMKVNQNKVIDDYHNFEGKGDAAAGEWVMKTEWLMVMTILKKKDMLLLVIDNFEEQRNNADGDWTLKIEWKQGFAKNWHGEENHHKNEDDSINHNVNANDYLTTY